MMPKPHPAVIFKPVSEGAVLLHTESEVYFGLNHVGARVWQLLGERHELDTVIGTLVEEYPEVDEERIREDVRQLLDDLVENDLVLSGGVSESPQATP